MRSSLLSKVLPLVLAAQAVSWGASALASAAEHTRVTNPSAIGGEVLGRGVLWSVFFDRVVTDDIAAGIGFGTVPARGSAGISDQTAVLIPAYMNFYFSRQAGSLYATGGVSLVTNAGTVQDRSAITQILTFSDLPFIPQIGFGYENRGDSGFLFRVTAYAMLAKNLAPWLGFSFGYAF